MADLFEGLPQRWIHSDDDSAHEHLSDDIFDWVHNKAALLQRQPPEWLQAFGDRAYHAMDNTPIATIEEIAARHHAPGWLQSGGEAVNQAMTGLMGEPDISPDASLSRQLGTAFSR